MSFKTFVMKLILLFILIFKDVCAGFDKLYDPSIDKYQKYLESSNVHITATEKRCVETGKFMI